MSKGIKKEVEAIEDAKHRGDEYVILTLDAQQQDMLLGREEYHYICATKDGGIAITWLSSFEDLNRLRSKIKKNS